MYQPVSEQRETARVALAVANQRLDDHDQRAVELRDYRTDDTPLDQAIASRRTWAAGHTTTGTDLDAAVEQLARHTDTVPEARALLTTLDSDHPALHPPVRQMERADVDDGIEL